MELSCSLVNRPPFPPPPHHSPLPTGRAAYTLNDGPYSRVCATVYSPLGHAGLPLDGCLPRRPLAHVASARAFLPVHWYARLLHPAVASQPPKVPSNEKSHDWRVRRPTISMPARRRRQRGLLRPSSGNTPRGNTYVLVFTGVVLPPGLHLTVDAAFTAESAANALVNEHISLWVFTRVHRILSENGLRSARSFSHAVYHPHSSFQNRHHFLPSQKRRWCGMCEPHGGPRARLAMVVNKRKDVWNSPLPHVEFSFNSSVSAATDFTPNEVRMGRLPRLSLPRFSNAMESPHTRGLARDHLPRPPRTGDGPPTPSVQSRPRAPCPHRFARCPPKLCTARRTAPGFPLLQ